MKKLLEQAETFLTKVPVDLYVSGTEEDIDHIGTVSINYNIEVEYRSWGIKSIDFSFIEKVELWYGELDSYKQETIMVDLSDATVEYESGEGGDWIGSFYPSMLYVEIDRKTKTVKDIRITVRKG